MIHCFAYGQSPPTRDPIFILKAGLWFHTWLTANIGQPETHKLFFGGRLWFRTWSRRQRQRPQKRCGIKEHCWTYCQAMHDIRKVETARGRRSVRSPSGDSSCKIKIRHRLLPPRASKTGAHFDDDDGEPSTMAGRLPPWLAALAGALDTAPVVANASADGGECERALRLSLPSLYIRPLGPWASLAPPHPQCVTNTGC